MRRRAGPRRHHEWREMSGLPGTVTSLRARSARPPTTPGAPIPSEPLPSAPSPDEGAGASVVERIMMPLDGLPVAGPPAAPAVVPGALPNGHGAVVDPSADG